MLYRNFHLNTFFQLANPKKIFIPFILPLFKFCPFNLMNSYLSIPSVILEFELD